MHLAKETMAQEDFDFGFFLKSVAEPEPIEFHYFAGSR
jgi:hypothetical protein